LWAHCNILQPTAKHCNTLQHYNLLKSVERSVEKLARVYCGRTVTRCNPLQHTATHCNTTVSSRVWIDLWRSWRVCIAGKCGCCSTLYVTALWSRMFRVCVVFSSSLSRIRCNSLLHTATHTHEYTYIHKYTHIHTHVGSDLLPRQGFLSVL